MAFSVSHLGGAEPTLDNLSDLERKELAALSKVHAAAAAAAAASSAPLVAVDRSVSATVQAYESAAGASRVFGRGGGGGNGTSSASTTLLDDGGDDFMDSYVTRTPKVSEDQLFICHRHREIAFL